jgi:hypothetical protein
VQLQSSLIFLSPFKKHQQIVVQTNNGNNPSSPPNSQTQPPRLDQRERRSGTGEGDPRSRAITLPKWAKTGKARALLALHSRNRQISSTKKLIRSNTAGSHLFQGS